MRPRPPRSTLTEPRFPYTTLFRSDAHHVGALVVVAQGHEVVHAHRARGGDVARLDHRGVGQVAARGGLGRLPRRQQPAAMAVIAQQGGETGRSEEHTSELQSLMRISYAVFCFEKKKQK